MCVDSQSLLRAACIFSILTIFCIVFPTHVIFFFKFSSISAASFTNAVSFSDMMVVTPECFTFRAVKSSC